MALDNITDGLQKIEHIFRTQGDTLSRGQIEELTNMAKTLQREYRLERSKQDILYFAYEYFSADRNPDNADNIIPSGVQLSDAPDFHRQLCDTLYEVAWVNPTKNIGWSAPRGHAKSAYLSNIFPIYVIVHDLRKYIILISETAPLSEALIAWITNQLKFNTKLREDFGEFLSSKKSMNDKDNVEGFVTNTGIQVKASSTGKQLRGSRHGSYRPDLVIMDDLESKSNTNTKELRDKNLLWFNTVVRPIGDPEKTAFIYMGTLVHAQGLLPAVLNMSDFDSRIYSAVVSPPDRQDLWQELEDILRDPRDVDRLERAYEFYNAHKEEMDAGVKVLWESRFTYFDLVILKINIGARAFASEYLNKPSDNEDAIFKPEYFTFFTDSDLYDSETNKPKKLDIIGFWDIAIGKNDRSDYNAIITIGVDKSTGIIYVLDAWMAKCPMHEALQVAYKKIKEYQHNTFVVETVQAQWDMYRQLKQIVTKDRIYRTRLVSANPRVKKEVRIEAMQPMFENSVVKLRKSQFLLLEMLEMYPEHNYDDGPDALAGAIEHARITKKTFFKKPVGF
jgi:phage uncharacterized protein (putative large terminase), C-terminal domain